MNATATKEKITALDFDTIGRRPKKTRLRVVNPRPGAEETLKAMILKHPKGKSLLKFCTELSTVLVRSYLVENDASELREKLCSNPTLTLACGDHEAHCLVDLALELIHAKVHRKSRLPVRDLKYLISRAARAL